MKIDEIIALAKAGYKKKDIDKIIEENEANEVAENEANEVNQEEAPEVDAEEIIEAEPEVEPDFKKLYEDTLHKLQTAQKENINKNIEAEKVDTKSQVDDIIKTML